MTMTKRQDEIMKLVMGASLTGKWLDIDQLLSKLGVSITKQALQCSIRFLEAKGLVARSYETRRERRRMVIAPTSVAYRK